MVLGGLELISYTTLFTPSTSFTILVLILSKTLAGSLTQSAVMASVLPTALIIIGYSYVLSSPITPTLLMLGSTAKDCQIFLYNPALFISSTTISSASWSIFIFSSVTSPIILIARPGPGKGCLQTISSGRPSSIPIFLISSLNNNLKGSINLIFISSGSPPTLWCDFILAASLVPLSMTSEYSVPCTR